MVRKEFAPRPDKPSARELANSIIASYDGHLDFLKTIQLSKSLGKDSGHLILAKNYASLSEDQREIFWQSSAFFNSDTLLKLQYEVAHSLARVGDFTLVNKLGQFTGVDSPDTQIPIARSFMEIVLEQARQGENFSETLGQAKKEMEALMVSKDLEGHQSLFGLLAFQAATVRDVGEDPKPYLKKTIDYALERDRKVMSRFNNPSDYDSNRIDVVGVFIREGFIEEALDLFRSLPSSQDKALNYLLHRAADKLIELGRLEEGIGIIEKIDSKPSWKAISIARAAVEATQRGHDAHAYMQKAQALLEQIPQEDLGDHVSINLLLAKAEHVSGRNPNRYFNIAVEKTAQAELFSQADFLISILKTQAETITVQKNTLVQLLDTAERFNWNPTDNPDNDKLDRMEALMDGEKVTEAFIDLGLFDLAKKYLQRLIKAYDKDEELEGKVSVVEWFAKIACGEIKLGIPNDKIGNLTKDEIPTLLQMNDPLLNRALGYFGVINSEELKTLPAEARIALLVGINQKETSRNGEAIVPIDIFDKAKDAKTTRALVKSLESTTVFANTEHLRQLLDQELANGKDYSVIGRLLKGLIEMDDQKGKDVATQLFVDETVPQRFRLYLARKLCDSGHWDRQIITYFRNYQHQGEKGNFFTDIKIDSLAAIINQMHTTPSLELYKVFEKTRLSKDKEALADIASFGSPIFLLPETSLEEKLNIFSFWAEKHRNGEIAGPDLEYLSTCFQKLSQSEQSYRQRYNIDKRYSSTIAQLKSLYKHPKIREIIGEVSMLLQKGIFPTNILIRFTQEHGAETEALLQSMQDKTEAGSFDPTNIVQRDLEFSKYLVLSGKDSGSAYHDFSNVEVLESEGLTRELNRREIREAEAAAYEAARFYWFVKERVDLGRKVTVVGNRRYGDYFVVEPLRQELEELGVLVRSNRIGSTGTTPHTVFDVFSKAFIQGLVGEEPDVIIVDGTSRLFDGDNARLPQSMSGYINWFHAFNQAAGQTSAEAQSLANDKEYQKIVQKISNVAPQKPYKIAYFLSKPTGKINVGGQVVAYSKPGSDGPYVVFANPVIDPKSDPDFPKGLDHKPGYLDDPEKLLQAEKIIAFTKKGLQQVHKGQGDEGQFVNSIQQHMIRVLPRMIKQTDPLFS